MSFKFTIDQIAFFETEEYSRIRAQIERETEKYTDTLRLQTFLRKSNPNTDTRFLAASIEQHRLRTVLKRKMPLNTGLIGTEDLVQQASSQAAAAVHAGFFSKSQSVLECCPGMGLDTIAIGGVCKKITSVEMDPVTACIWQYNMNAAGISNASVVVADAAEYLPAEAHRFDAVFADPARRVSGTRTLDTGSYSPPLSSILGGIGRIPAVIKLAPANAPDDGARVYVGHEGECKELLLLINTAAPTVRVVDAVSGVWWTPSKREQPSVDKWNYIIEPHNAIIASGCVESYFHEVGCIAIDDEIAYGVSHVPPIESVFHTAFEVINAFPFSLKRLQRAVDALRFDKRTELKKRGFPMLPEELHKRITFIDSGVRGTIIATRTGEKHVVFLCRRLGCAKTHKNTGNSADRDRLTLLAKHLKAP